MGVIAADAVDVESLVRRYLGPARSLPRTTAGCRVTRSRERRGKEAPGNHFSFTARPGPAANDVGPLDKYGVIFDAQGKVLAATQPFDVVAPRLKDLNPVTDAPFDFSFAGSRYRAVETHVPGFPRHRLLLAASREDLDGDSRFVRKAMAIALLVSALCLLTAIGWLVRRTMREHNRIADTLHRIALGETDARVPAEVSDVELRRLGSDIDEIAGRLATLLSQQRRFIAHAAHELRSPLAALHGEIQQAMRKERSVDEYKTSLGFLLRASGRLKLLADQLLDLARAQERPPVDPGGVAGRRDPGGEGIARAARERERHRHSKRAHRLRGADRGQRFGANHSQPARQRDSPFANWRRHPANGGISRARASSGA